MKRKIIVLILLLFVCIALFPYYFAQLHIWKMKKDLNNPIINGGYRSWHSILLDENIEIKLPDDWSLETREGIAICDNSGTPVAFGVKFDEFTESRRDEQWRQLLSDCAGYTVASYTPEFFCEDQFGNLASVRWIVCSGESGPEERITLVQLPYHYQYTYYLCFIGDGELYCDAAEAIAWSMSYTDE